MPCCGCSYRCRVCFAPSSRCCAAPCAPGMHALCVQPWQQHKNEHARRNARMAPLTRFFSDNVTVGRVQISQVRSRVMRGLSVSEDISIVLNLRDVLAWLAGSDFLVFVKSKSKSFLLWAGAWATLAWRNCCCIYPGLVTACMA